jgi:hypothetical protein
MNPIVLTAWVDADGVLTVRIPLGKAEANQSVRVMVEPVGRPVAPMNREAWLKFIQETAGSITDPTFERGPQGEYEQREPWP